MESLLTADIRDTLEYTDDTTYMRQGLIPAKEEIAIQAFNLDGVNKCVDKNGYSACSVYQFTLTNYDTRRTTCHNIVIQNIGFLNIMADRYNLEPVYTGVVSTQRPHRRVLANEVLEYVEYIVKERR
mgnify:CR=1 FL=1